VLQLAVIRFCWSLSDKKPTLAGVRWSRMTRPWEPFKMRFNASGWFRRGRVTSGFEIQRGTLARGTASLRQPQSACRLGCNEIWPSVSPIPNGPSQGTCA
jgi:hypothetical protein